MSIEEVPHHDVLPPECGFYRGIIADPFNTDHDRALTVAHTKSCDSCKNAIGRMIHERIENNIQAEPGT